MGLFGDLVLLFAVEFALFIRLVFEFVEFGKVIERSCFLDGSLSLFFLFDNQTIDGFFGGFFYLFPEGDLAISEIAFIIVFIEFFGLTMVKSEHGLFSKLVKRKAGRTLMLRMKCGSLSRLQRRIPLIDNPQLVIQLLLVIT